MNSTLDPTFQRALFLTVGTDSAASSRVRASSVISVLQLTGWSIRRIPATKRLWPLLAGLSMAVHRPQIVVLQKILPPKWFVKFLRKFAETLVLEIDDAIYLGYPGAEGNTDRTVQRLTALAEVTDKVITSNALIAQDLKSFGATNISVFPGPAPKVATYPPKLSSRDVVWLGSPSTYPLVLPVLKALVLGSDPGEFQIHAVGAGSRAELVASVEYLEWSPEAQELALDRAAIGLLPSQIGPWEERKAAYKVLEYLAHGVRPVCPNSPALDTLLGPDASTLIEEVELPETAESWSAAVRAGVSKPVDPKWFRARDRVLDRWSVEEYAKLFMPEPWQ